MIRHDKRSPDYKLRRIADTLWYAARNGGFEGRAILAGFVIAVYVLGHVLFWIGDLITWQFVKPQDIKPVHIGNGETQYTLVRTTVNKGVPFDFWRLNFPDALTVVRPEDDKDFVGISRDRKSHFNKELTLFLNLPDISLQPNPVSAYKDGGEYTLNVIIHSRLVEYGSGQARAWENNFSSYLIQKFKPECKNIDEIAPGLFQGRETTLQKDMIPNRFRKNIKSEHCYSTVGSNDYLLVDIDGQIAGDGRCSQPSENPLCQFKVWLPQKRTATYQFRKEYLPNIQKIHAFVVGFISEATVPDSPSEIGKR